MSGFYKVDGRGLEIKDESKASAKAKELAEMAILKFFRNNYLAHKLKSLKITLDDGQSAIAPNEAASYNDAKHMIFIHMNKFELELATAGESAAFLDLSGQVAHEASHALRREMSEVIKLEKTIEERIRNSVRRSAAELAVLSSKGETPKELIVMMREMPTTFISKLQYEGIGEFIREMVAGGIGYDSTTFSQLYNLAIEKVKNYVEVYRELLNVYEKALINAAEVKRLDQLITRLIEIPPHYIGLHMTHALVLCDEERIENIYEYLITLLKMTPYVFIKRYESAVEKRGVKPVISLVSGRGMLDYSALLKLFYELVKRLR